MNRTFAKVMLCVVAPFALLYIFLKTLIREIGRAFWYARQEVLIELESLRHIIGDRSK